MKHTFIKCPHCKHVRHIVGGTYDYTIGSPLSKCEMCGKPVLDNRKREWIMLSPFQKIWHFFTIVSVLPSTLIGLFFFISTEEMGDGIAFASLILATLLTMSIWGYIRYHKESVQKEIKESIQRTEDSDYRMFLDKHYTLYDTHIPFRKENKLETKKNHPKDDGCF